MVIVVRVPSIESLATMFTLAFCSFIGFLLYTLRELRTDAAHHRSLMFRDWVRHTSILAIAASR